ncbi:hypothetical protein K438DRAFT_1962917 [Mycena galopus ATCC 62051]|nr:hypothetical protein K438DRAFT_1962917 [Mycena galopus ATCC 62051]
MAISPTFSSSLQSVYYGQTVLPDGQVLHHSTSMNMFRIFQDRDTGLPIMMTGHKFTFHLTCPEDPHTLWSLEAPYPTDAQMQDIMCRFMPPMVGGAVALSFPMHGMEVAPPMLPIEGPAGCGSATEVLCDEMTAVAPDQFNTTNLMRLPRGIAVPTPRRLLASGRDARQVITDFEEQLYRCASKSLQLDNDFFETHCVEEDEDTSMAGSDNTIPDLVSVTSEGDQGGTSIEVELCDMCLASRHESELDCPRSGAGIDEGMGMGHLLNVLTGDEETAAEVEGWKRPAVNEHQTIEAETSETRCTPKSSVPAAGDETFRRLVDAAVDARRSFEEYTVEYDGIGKEESHTIIWGDVDQTGSGVPIRAVMPFSPPSTQLYLPPRHRTPEPEDQHNNNGTPVLRHHSSAPLSYADRVVLPSPASLPSGPLHSVEDNEDMGLADRTEAIISEEWNPAVSEEVWGWLSSYPPSYATDSIEPSSTSSESRSGFSCTSRYEFYDDNNFELHESLSFWVWDGNEHQHNRCHFENEMGVEPLHQVLQALHGPLSFFVDYLAMARQGVKDIIASAFSPSPFSASVFPAAPDLESSATTKLTSDAPPSPTAAPTSLDRSLPVTAGHSPASPGTYEPRHV